MKIPRRETCLRSFDFASYLTGATCDYEKALIEQHLSECDFCFDTFITAFNQHLDHASIHESELDSTRACQFA